MSREDPAGSPDYEAIIEEYLAGLGFSNNPRLSVLIEAMRHSFLAGGERVRPVLCMEVARTFGRDPVEVLPSAAAIELVHTLSLVHGGLPAMDQGGLRRGRSTSHLEFGEATAILAGDSFFGESLALITRHQKGSAEQLLAVVRELATSTGVNGMVGGHAIDANQGGDAVDAETLSRTYGYKTGALFGASARIGAILAGAGHEEQRAVSRYALRLGLCWQLVDDVLEGAGNDVRRLADQALEEALESLEPLEPLEVDPAGLARLARFARYRGL